MQAAVPFACFLSLIRPPGIQFENALLQIIPVDKSKCPFVRDHTDINFQLFTRHNPTVYEELKIGDDEKLFASSIDFNDPTVIYFHAFMEQPDDGSGIMIREAYMQRGDTNVVMIDAHQLEAGPWYFTAAQNTWYIGNFAAQFIDYLVSRGLDLRKTHLVGHSLGAQSAGVAGAALKTGRVSRITGLDPALPLFDGLSHEQRLDSTDADFVDVIHTDAGIFGVKQPLGHVDFYPNGGQSPQPGCELRAILPEQLLLNTCDGHMHIRGYYTFSLHHKNGLIKTLSKHQTATPLTTAANHSENKINTNNKKEFTQDTAETDLHTQYFKDIVKVYENIEINNDIQSPNGIYKHTTVFTKDVETPSAYVSRKTKKPNKGHYQQFNGNFDRPIFIPSEKVTIDRNDAETRDNTDLNNEIERENDMSKRWTVLNDEIQSENYLLKQLNIDRIEKNSEGINDFIEINEIIPHNKLNVYFKVLPDDVRTFDKDEKGAVTKNNRDTVTANNDLNEDITAYSKTKSHVVKRDRRSLSLFNSNDNLLFRILNFLSRNRKSILPVLTVMREINTLVRSGNSELSNFIKERNSYVGAIPSLSPVTFSVELGSEARWKTFVKKLFGLDSSGDRLTVTGSR